ncbi:MAG: cadmium-translocating P-type ATPase [Clostridia bacterium]|nr:cadmium-translocating P-type ATPase [Clostridia bacterium]
MKIKIEGLDCPNCAKALEQNINKLESVQYAQINFLKGYIEFNSHDDKKAVDEIVQLTKKLEPNARIILEKGKKNNKKMLLDMFLLFFGLVLGVCCLFVSMPAWLFWVMFSLSALCLGYKTFYKALALLLKGTINENLLVTISVVGATAIGEHMEALMVIALYSIGKLLENMAINKSKRSIEKLTNFKPEYAVVIDGEKEIKVEPKEIKLDDIIIVRPGERIAVDGVVVEGSASLDLQSLTGESLPVLTKTDEQVLSGAIVLDGVLKIRVLKEYEDSTVNKIINLIETASDKKSKTETFISKITKWYTLGVILLAVIVLGIVFAITKNFDTALYRGLIFLVISCPCAFAISVPLTYFSGLGNASKNGILIKGSNYLDACAKLNLVAFDKTGTLTTGDFEIVKIQSLNEQYTQQDILFLAGLGEQYSLHPLAKTIASANSTNLQQIDNFKEVAGEGVYFEYENNNYFVGKRTKNLEGTVVELFKNDGKLGHIVLQDKIKDAAAHAINALKKQNVNTVMLTGDNKSVAQHVAQHVKIDEVNANLLPQQKYEWLRNKLSQKNNIVGFVGDGLNDAPSLTLANVGFCMGLKGNSASIEASDIVIANDNIQKIPQAIEISKYTRKIVWQNILFSALIKITFLTLGAIGITGMLSAVIADVGVTVLAILNSLRALTHKTKHKIYHEHTHTHSHHEHECCCHHHECKHE